MPTFKRKPQVIEAEQFRMPTRPEILSSLPKGVRVDSETGLFVATDSNGCLFIIRDGDWIIREGDGRGYYTLGDERFKRYYQVSSQETSEERRLLELRDERESIRSELLRLAEIVRRAELALSQVVDSHVHLPLTDLVDKVIDRFKGHANMRERVIEEDFEVTQALGSVLGAKGFIPGNDSIVDVGEHTPTTLAITVKGMWGAMCSHLEGVLYKGRSIYEHKSLPTLVNMACERIKELSEIQRYAQPAYRAAHVDGQFIVSA